jgi:hypothetical protein
VNFAEKDRRRRAGEGDGVPTHIPLLLQFAHMRVFLAMDKHSVWFSASRLIASGEKDIGLLDAVAWYKQVMDVERSFRHLKDVLAMRPIYHQVEPRVTRRSSVTRLHRLVFYIHNGATYENRETSPC